MVTIYYKKLIDEIYYENGDNKSAETIKKSSNKNVSTTYKVIAPKRFFRKVLLVANSWMIFM